MTGQGEHLHPHSDLNGEGDDGAPDVILGTFTRVAPGLAAGALFAAAVLVLASPADAAKPVHNNITEISAFGYNAGSGDTAEITVQFDTDFKGKPSLPADQIDYTVSWKGAGGGTIQTVSPVRGFYPHATGMTLAVPGGTGFVALAQRAVITHVRSCFVDRPPFRRWIVGRLQRRLGDTSDGATRAMVRGLIH